MCLPNIPNQIYMNPIYNYQPGYSPSYSSSFSSSFSPNYSHSYIPVPIPMSLNMGINMGMPISMPLGMNMGLQYVPEDAELHHMRRSMDFFPQFSMGLGMSRGKKAEGGKPQTPKASNKSIK